MDVMEYNTHPQILVYPVKISYFNIVELLGRIDNQFGGGPSERFFISIWTC